MSPRTLPWPVLHRLAARAWLEDRAPGTGTAIGGCVPGVLMMRRDGRLEVVTDAGRLVEPVADWDAIAGWDDIDV